MKTQLLTALVVLGTAVGCVPNDTPIDIGNAFPFDAECKRVEDISQGGGSLNVGLSSVYRMSFDISSSLQPVEINSSSGASSDPSQNEAVVEEVRYTYTSRPDIGLKPVNSPTYWVISPGATESWIGLNLFPGDAGETLAANVVPGDRVEVIVGIQLVGKLRSGLSFETAVAKFPVTVGNAACPPETLPATGVGPCGNVGQDSAYLACCPPDQLDCFSK